MKLPTDSEIEYARGEIEAAFDVMVESIGLRYSSPDEVLDLWCRLYRVTAGGNQGDQGRLLCGSCGRVLCRLDAHIGAHEPWPIVMPRSSGLRRGRQNANPGGSKGATSASDGGRLTGIETRWAVSCRTSCGARRVVRAESLLVAYVQARENGRLWIVAGEGAAATARGGADI